MLELTHPLWLLALPVPYLIHRFVPAYRTMRSGLQVPFFDQLTKLIGEEPSEGAVQLRPSLWQRIAMVITWVMLVFAMTKPMVLGEPQTRQLVGRDVMIVVDLSGSMSEKDFTNAAGEKVDRLEAAKGVLADFSQNRQGDRLGLILFGDAAYLQAPFTADHQAWLDLLNEAQVAMAGPSTHLGDAIGLAIQVFSAEEAVTNASAKLTPSNKEKVVIILTDGNDTGSLVPPLEAAKVAASRDIRIHMIAMGDPKTVGEQELDMETIANIAEYTQGQSYLALSSDDLLNVYQQISELEPELYESTTYRPKTSIHYVPIAVAFSLYLLGFILSSLKRYHSSSERKCHV